MEQRSVLGKALDFLLLGMIIVYFIGFVSFHPQSVFLAESLLDISHEYEAYFEILLWAIFGLLALDLYFKYRKLADWKVFLKKHWHDIVMLALIPFLAGFKIAKISVNLIKTLKVSKAGFKILYKAKKASKHLK